MIDTLMHAAVCVVILGYCIYACRIDIANSAAATRPSGAARSADARTETQLLPQASEHWTALDERQLIRLLRDSAP